MSGETRSLVPEPIHYPPCEFKVIQPPALRGRNKPLGDACGSKSAYVVRGMFYCKRHAQSVALEILIKESKE